MHGMPNNLLSHFIAALTSNLIFKICYFCNQLVQNSVTMTLNEGTTFVPAGAYAHLWPNIRVDLVSASLKMDGEQQMTMVVLQFPPKESWRIRVILLSRYGTWVFWLRDRGQVSNILTIFFKANNDARKSCYPLCDICSSAFILLKQMMTLILWFYINISHILSIWKTHARFFWGRSANLYTFWHMYS